MTRPRGAVVGLRHGGRHVLALRNLNLDALYACDVDARRLQPFLEDPRIIPISTWSQLPPGLDFVVVAVPNHLHLELVSHFLSIGTKLVLCEKPLAPTSVELHRLRQHARSAHVVVIHELRLNPSLHKLGKLIGSSEKTSVHLCWRRDSLPSSDWALDLSRAGGGALLDLGIHLADLLVLLAGRQEVASASVLAASLERPAELLVEHGCAATLRIQDVMISLDVGWLGSDSDVEISVQISTASTTRALSSHRGTHRLLRTSPNDEPKLDDWYATVAEGNVPDFPGIDDAIVATQLIERIYDRARNP